MLNLTVRKDSREAVYLFGSDGKPLAKIKVIEVRGGQVSLGFQAPKNVNILRNAEHLISIEDQNKYDEFLRTSF